MDYRFNDSDLTSDELKGLIKNVEDFDISNDILIQNFKSMFLNLSTNN